MDQIHIILPPGCNPARSSVLENALAALAVAAKPYGGVAVHNGDTAYEHAKNPLWGHEAEPYNVPSPLGTDRPPIDLHCSRG